MSKRIVKPLLFLTLTIVVICYLLFVICSKPGYLEIRYTDTGKVLVKLPLNEYDEFVIEFIHSVNKSPVRETYRIEGGRIRLQNVRLYSFGAGFSDLNEMQKLSRDGDAMVISGFNVSYKELNLITGTASDHVLLVNNEIINLRELSGKPDGRNTRITIQFR